LYQLVVGDFTCPVTLEWADHVTEPLLREDLKRCFAGDPNNRFVSARELASQLRSLDHRREQRAAAVKEVLERGEGRIASLAVMPLANLSAEPESDFLSDGIAEDLITALSQVPGLRVPGRTSCFVFKNKAQDLRTIGQTLNVQSILEGSLRKAGNRLRVTVQLINVADGFHLWSERYDRTMADVFAIQDDISQSIVKALMPRLASRPSSVKVQAYGGNVEAYELCLRGRFQQQKWTPEGFALAIQFFQQALQRDPNYPLAYVGLSLVFSLISYFGGLRPDDGMVKGIAAAKRAIELDETLSDAHIRLADGLYFYERDWSGAEREFQRALELNPKNAEAHYRYGFFLWAHGRYEPAVAEIQVALELDPFCLDANWWLTFALISLKRFDEAIERGRKMVANDPSYWGGHSVQPMVDAAQGKWADAAEGYGKVTAMMPSPVNLGILCFFYGRAEKKNEAEQLLQQMEQMSRQQYVPQVWLALAYEGLKAFGLAQACLEQAIQDHDSAVVHVRGLGSWWPQLFEHSQMRLTGLGLW
jgi:serine/threonine-protein kinase